MYALEVYAGPAALRHLREHGLHPQDIGVIPAAAGGPKGLVLNPLDRYIFGEWMAGTSHTVHLLGASIGAWRMASACLADPAAALARMAHDYINQDYEHAPGKPPTPRHVSEVFGAKLGECFDGCEAQVLNHPRYRLHVFTSRGRHVLRREGRRFSPISTRLGYLGAFAANAVSRRAMGGWLERVVSSDPREALPHADWVKSLPDGRLPDRNDFLRYGDDYPARVKAWQRAVAESERLRDEFAALVTGGKPLAALPL